MAKRSGDPRLASPEALAFSEALGRWLGKHGCLCAAMRQARDRSETGQEDVGALLATPALAVARASWDLWDELRRSEGADPTAELRLIMGHERFDALRYVLWGALPSPRTSRQPSRVRLGR